MTKTIVGSSHSALVLLLAAVTTAAGCDPSEEPPLLGSALDRDLGPGASGPDVRAVQQYLVRYGYFPNDELARQYPQWAPVVGQSPTDGAYDRATELAVRAYQRMGGLEQTGVVDRATRELMQQPRCGMPDGERSRDPSDKFDRYKGPKWGKAHITWRVLNYPSNVGLDAFRGAIAAAFKTWSSTGDTLPSPLTTLTFGEVFAPANADIYIKLEPIEYRDGTRPAAEAFYPDLKLGNTVKLNSLYEWSVVPPQPRTRVYHVQTVMAHEIGHVLGLLHSSLQGLMKANVRAGDTRVNANYDDMFGIGLLYEAFEFAPAAPNIPLCARDIGVGPGAGSAFKVWAADCNGANEGLVHRWNFPSGWGADVTGMVAANIAVRADGIPWIVRAPNGPNIYRRSGDDPSSGLWVGPLGNLCAQDIGIGADNSVWVTRCEDGLLHRWAGGTSWTPDAQNGRATRVAVDADGLPWVVNGAMEIYRKTTNSPNTGVWSYLGVGAVDIAVHKRTWIDNEPGGVWAWIAAPDGSLWGWNEQRYSGPGPEPVPCDEETALFLTECSRAQWRKQETSVDAWRVGVGGYGPWAVTSASSHQVQRHKNW